VKRKEKTKIEKSNAFDLPAIPCEHSLPAYLSRRGGKGEKKKSAFKKEEGVGRAREMATPQAHPPLHSLDKIPPNIAPKHTKKKKKGEKRWPHRRKEGKGRAGRETSPPARASLLHSIR